MSQNGVYEILPSNGRSIRLLSIEPGYPLDPIQVGLVVINDLTEAPEYDALSYAWGLEVEPQPISCNGLPIEVKSNLASALRAFRPLPLDAKEGENDVVFINEKHILHSSRNAWKDFGQNRNEKVISERTESRLIWIDALCINQNNMQECSEQVKIMRQIYSSAHTVRIWLGKELKPPPTLEVISVNQSRTRIDQWMSRKLLVEFGSMPVVLAFLAQALRNKDSLRSDTTFGVGFPPLDAPEWDILRAFFQQSWFHRVWTVQEVVVAARPIVVVGDWEFHWVPFSDAVLWFASTALRHPILYRLPGIKTAVPWGGIPIKSAVTMIEIRHTAGTRPTLLSLLRAAQIRAATKPDDYVYAVLALSVEFFKIDAGESLENMFSDSHAQAIRKWYSGLLPDYSRPLEYTLANVAVFIISLYKSLQVLQDVEHNEEFQLQSCPSWVPIWSNPRRSNHLMDWSRFNADAGERLEYTAGKSNVLSIRGLIFDEVVSVTPTLETTSESLVIVHRTDPTPEEVAFVKSAWKLVQKSYPQYRYGGDSNMDLSMNEAEAHCKIKNKNDVLEDFITTLTANRIEKVSADRSVLRAQAMRWFSSYLFHENQPTRIWDFLRKTCSSLFVIDQSEEFQQILALTCSWRRFLITRTGCLGVGPGGMREGDRVVILFGSHVPFIVRPVLNSGRNQWALIGECYIHGIMSGEAVERWKREEGESFIFDIA